MDPASRTAVRRLRRRTLLRRRGEGARLPQLMAANVDTLFVVTSCNDDFNPARLERYLAFANEAEVEPVVLLTKADRIADARSYRARAEALQRGLCATDEPERAEARARYGAGERPRRLLSAGNAKLAKRGGVVEDWFLTGLSLAPSDVSGYEMCADKTPECSRFCLFATGQALADFHGPQVPHNPIWVSRIMKTLWFMEDRPGFMRKLAIEIANLTRRHDRLAVRLNMFSDRPWEVDPVTVTGPMHQRYGLPQGEFRNLMELFPRVQFYDYTKLAKRIRSDRVPGNCHLTYSLTETNLATALEVLEAGRNVAVVTAAPLETFHGFPVVDGDRNDFRFMDRDGVAVLLKPKGALARSGSPFVYTPVEEAA